MADKPLTPLERRFAPLYLELMDATEAYMQASPRAKSRNGAGVNAWKLLRRPHVQAHLRALLARSEVLAEMSIEQVLGELSLIAQADPTWYRVADDGTVTLVTGAPPQATRALESVECTTTTGEDYSTTRTKVRLCNKLGSLRTLCEYHGILTQRVDVTSRGKQIGSMSAAEITAAVVAALRDPGVRARVRAERPEILKLVERGNGNGKRNGHA